MAPYFQSGGITLYVGDNRDVVPTLPAGSIGAVVTDPPYELSDSGKASAARVALELMFPKQAQIKAKTTGEDCLPFLVQQILGLRSSGLLPGPSAPMPVSAVTLDHDSPRWDEDVEHSGEGAISVSNSERWNHVEPEIAEHLGDFQLELADPAAALDAFNSLGCGFTSGGIGIGFRIAPASLPSLLGGGGGIAYSDMYIGSRHDALAHLVGALSRATHIPVLRLHLGRSTEEQLSTDGALMFCLVAFLSGAKLVRAGTGTRGLPSVLESRRVCIVDSAADRALSLSLVLHPQSIAGKGFMGKEWDGSRIAFNTDLWSSIRAVMEPGAHLLSFGGTRTFHRVACAIEDAGFEIKDTLSWLYGSGFPKHKSLLKPGWEPIILARKPGKGVLQIDACRIGVSPDDPNWRPPAPNKYHLNNTVYGKFAHGNRAELNLSPAGRWPANVLLDEDAATALDAQSGERKSNSGKPFQRNVGGFARQLEQRSDSPEHIPASGGYYGDTGGASRFFYVAKASRSERGEGNMHPTVKPLALMRWLLTLVTPPGATILDPFAGSGSTLVAAAHNGIAAIGIEQSEEYAEIAARRIEHALAQARQLEMVAD